MIVSPLRTYVRRLRIWQSIIDNVRPLDRRSRSAFRRSVIACPFTSAQRLRVWQDPILLGPATVEVAEFGKFNLRPRTDDLWHVTPRREPHVSAEIRSRLRPGDTFVDAGANIGVFTVQAARIVGAHGKVIAIEMVPFTATILRENISLNESANVTVVERAISANEGEIVKLSVRQEQAGQATIVLHEREQTGDVFSVCTTTLGTILKDVDRVALMKIDIEGAELSALQGAGEHLRKIEAIIFESLPGSDRVEDFLAESGYRLRQLQGRNFLAEREGADATT